MDTFSAEPTFPPLPDVVGELLEIATTALESYMSNEHDYTSTRNINSTAITRRITRTFHNCKIPPCDDDDETVYAGKSSNLPRDQRTNQSVYLTILQDFGVVGNHNPFQCGAY